MSRTDERAQDWEPLAPLSRSAGGAIMTFWVAMTLVSLVWWGFDSSGIFLFSGCAACGILSLPMVVGRQFDLVSPWSLVLVGGYIGFGIRGLFITLGIDGTRTLEQLYFLGREPAWFNRSALLILAGMLLFTLGYIAASSGKVRARKGRMVTSHGFNERLVPGTVVALAAIGFFAFIMYADSTGGLSLARISGKRTVIGGLNLQADYQSFGQWRFINSLSAVALWLQVAFFAAKGVPHGLRTPRGWWVVALFLNACLLPFYASTRADVVYVLITAVVMEICLQRRQFRIRRLVIPAVIGVAAVVALTGLRQADSGLDQGSTQSRLVDAFVLTHTFSDMPTTTHIMRAVPDRIPFAHGGTIVSWLAAPIPRALWPGKPIISLGPTIGILVFGNVRAGIPPGLIAESYWDFGVAGILVMPLLAGIGVGWIYRRLAPYSRESPAAAVLFAAVAVRPGIDMTSNAIGFTILQAAQTLAVLVPILMLVRTRDAMSVDDRAETVTSPSFVSPPVPVSSVPQARRSQ